MTVDKPSPILLIGTPEEDGTSMEFPPEPDRLLSALGEVLPAAKDDELLLALEAFGFAEDPGGSSTTR